MRERALKVVLMPPLKTGFIGASILLVVIGATLLALLPKSATEIAG